MYQFAMEHNTVVWYIPAHTMIVPVTVTSRCRARPGPGPGRGRSLDHDHTQASRPGPGDRESDYPGHYILLGTYHDAPA
jgi:hypothetical protein